MIERTKIIQTQNKTKSYMWKNIFKNQKTLKTIVYLEVWIRVASQGKYQISKHLFSKKTSHIYAMFFGFFYW